MVSHTFTAWQLLFSQLHWSLIWVNCVIKRSSFNAFQMFTILLFNTVLDYRFYWQVHNPQNALAWHLLSGAWESSQGCGQALYTTLELHQGERFTTPVLRPWPAQFKFCLWLTGFWIPFVNFFNITLSSDIWWSIIRFCHNKDFLLI